MHWHTFTIFSWQSRVNQSGWDQCALLHKSTRWWWKLLRLFWVFITMILEKSAQFRNRKLLQFSSCMEVTCFCFCSFSLQSISKLQHYSREKRKKVNSIWYVFQTTYSGNSVKSSSIFCFSSVILIPVVLHWHYIISNLYNLCITFNR